MDIDLEEILSFANHLADAAGPIALRYFRTPLEVVTKADESPVTRADREIEHALRGLIRERFPVHGVIGEEEGGSAGARYTWVLDPIDGTKSFVTGCPLFGTLIGFLAGDHPLVGVIDIPTTAERWSGNGENAALGATPAAVSRCESLALARLYTTSLEYFDPGQKKHFERLDRSVALTRYSGDCYAYGLLASGHCDLVVDADLAPYDYLPIVPVVTGAGGHMSDWEGRPLTLRSGGHVVAASSRKLLDAALEILRPR